MTAEDTFTGPNGDFATAVVTWARHALNNTAHGKPWPEMPDEPTHVAVALVLAETEQLQALQSVTLQAAIRRINEGLASPLLSMYAAEQFFFAVRAQVDEATYASFWDQAPQDERIQLRLQ